MRTAVAIHGDWDWQEEGTVRTPVLLGQEHCAAVSQAVMLVWARAALAKRSWVLSVSHMSRARDPGDKGKIFCSENGVSVVPVPGEVVSPPFLEGSSPHGI